MSTPFNQAAPSFPTVINTSNCLVFGNTASTALSVRQFGTGPVMNVSNAAGTSALYVDPTGKVGIGTTSPSSNFQVAQGGTANLGNGLYTQLNSMGQTAASLLAGYNTGSGPTLAGGEYTWTIGNLDTNGAITNNPPFVPGGTYLITWNVRSTSAGVTFSFENPSFNSLYASPTLTSSYQNLSFYVTIPSNGQALTNYRVYGGSTKNIIWNAYSVQRLDTLVTGNLGVGTTSPGYTTEISTSTSSTNTSFLGLTNPYAFGFNTGLNIGSSIVYSSRWQGDGLSGIVEMCKIDGRKEQNANYGDSYLAFQTRYVTDRVNGGAGTLTEKMRITGNGNVGIGTTTPNATLDVFGNVHSYNMTQVSKTSTAGNTVALPNIAFTVSWDSAQGDGQNPIIIEVAQTVGNTGGGYYTRMSHVFIYSYNDNLTNPSVLASTQITTSSLSITATPTVSTGGRASSTSVTVTTTPGYASTSGNRSYTIHARAICIAGSVGNVYFA